MGASNEQIQAVMRQSVSNDFGISRDTIFATFPNIPTGRFAYLLNDDRAAVDKIWDIVESEGVSPAVWTAYESNEGYNSSWGWLNHTSWQGDVYEDARAIARWLKNFNGSGYTPAWDDPGGGTVGVVPADVQARGNAEYAGWSNDTIGKTYCAGTAAAAWGMWYPDALSAKVNGVQNYGNPLSNMADLIFNKWGGKVDGESVGNNNASPSKPNETTVKTTIDNSGKRQEMLDKLNEMFDALKKKFNKNVYSASQQYMFNKVVKLTREMNQWHVKLSDKALDEIKKILEDAIGSILADETVEVSGSTNGDVKPNENTQNTQNQPASDRVTNALNKIAGFIGGGTPGADFGSGNGYGNLESQCYALSGYFAGLVSGYTCAVSAYGSTFQSLSLIGDGNNAYNIWSGWDWSPAGAHTKGYPGTAMPASDLKKGMIFGTAPNFNGPTGTVDGGGYAYLQTGGYGHTGVIESFTDSTITTIEQNAYISGGSIAPRRVARITYPLQEFLNTVTGVVWWD